MLSQNNDHALRQQFRYFVLRRALYRAALGSATDDVCAQFRHAPPGVRSGLRRKPSSLPLLSE